MINLDFSSVDDILLKRKSLRRELAGSSDLKDLRIAILGGSTTNEVVNLLELLLLSTGFRPVFRQSEYGRFYEDAVHDIQAVVDFKPDLVFLHTSFLNVRYAPPINCTENDLQRHVEAEMHRYRQIWDSLESSLACQIIQNNFEMPPYAIQGNLDAAASGGLSRFLVELNGAFAREIIRRPRLLLQDVHGLSSRMGLKHWFDWSRYFAYKVILTAEANLELARSLHSLVRAIYGKSRKVLVLDLDNTLWGGIIGDDGVEKIQIGRETPVAEAYTAFQQYCLSLKDRGILLAVCSKNVEEIAMSGFQHPSSLLKLEHISCFKANWHPKHENLLAIAAELNLGIDSFVFVDDNPAERAIVAAQLPGVAVPDIGSDVTRFAEIIEQGRYFETTSLSNEDIFRAELYAGNTRRATLATKFADYGQYLDSLEMSAEIAGFKPIYLDRIAQLTNKTNQFNLTTRRYTLAEMETISIDSRYIGLYGKLTDRFGDNGLVSVVLGHKKEDRSLHMDLWLMSCRVLKRDMEVAMLDALTAKAKEMNIRTIYGYYLPTKKNCMVANLYSELGFLPCFAPVGLPEGTTVWTLDLADYTTRGKHIKIMEYAHG